MVTYQFFTFFHYSKVENRFGSLVEIYNIYLQNLDYLSERHGLLEILRYLNILPGQQKIKL